MNLSNTVTTSEQIAVDWTSTFDYKKLTPEEEKMGKNNVSWC
jgi:hypothetical protein